jgi:FkbM family methyltransferase
MSLPVEQMGGPYLTVFDVGAFQGDFATAALSRWTEATVLSFEPLLDPPVALQSHPRWSWERIALGEKVGKRTMHVSSFIPSSSLFPMLELHAVTYPYTAGGHDQEVEVGRLRDYTVGIEKPALLKIDTQGSEIMVMRGARKNVEPFHAIALEVTHVPLYDGSPLVEEVEAFLQEAGFRFVSVLDIMEHPETGELLQSDQFWVRAT